MEIARLILKFLDSWLIKNVKKLSNYFEINLELFNFSFSFDFLRLASLGDMKNSIL
jgi:hypothetical protein